MRRPAAPLAQTLSCIHHSWIKTLQYALPFRMYTFKPMYFTGYQEKGSWTLVVLTLSGDTPRKILSFTALMHVETICKKNISRFL